MLDRLDARERLLLLRFVCSFAWLDGEVAESERRFARRLLEKLALSPDDEREVHSWLLAPPDPPDASQIPPEHRRAFVETLRAMMFVDGKIDPAEREHFDRLVASLS